MKVTYFYVNVHLHPAISGSNSVCVSTLVSFCTRAGDELNEWRAEH